jgi:hypothetical protein
VIRHRRTSVPHETTQNTANNKSDGNKNSQLNNQQRHMVSSYSKLLKPDEHIRRQFFPAPNLPPLFRTGQPAHTRTD